MINLRPSRYLVLVSDGYGNRVLNTVRRSGDVTTTIAITKGPFFEAEFLETPTPFGTPIDFQKRGQHSSACASFVRYPTSHSRHNCQLALPMCHGSWESE